MATTDHKAPGSALRARIDERFFAPFQRNTVATRTWLAISLASVVVLHGTVLGYFLYRDTRPPLMPARQEETSVELVVQPPPPPPQQQAQQQEIEKPASSAPRTQSETKVDTDKLDPKTQAPKAVMPLRDGQPQPTPDTAATNTQASEHEDKEASAPPPDILKADEEALDKAEPTPRQDKTKAQKTKITAKLKVAKPAQRQFAGLSDMPDYKFARPTKKSPVSGGTEDARYLAIVYGLIMRNVHSSGDGVVGVSFELDDDGNVVSLEMRRSSGNRISDADVVNAIQLASPFPPPPPNRTHILSATINLDDNARSLDVGAQ